MLEVQGRATCNASRPLKSCHQSRPGTLLCITTYHNAEENRSHWIEQESKIKSLSVGTSVIFKQFQSIREHYCDVSQVEKKERQFWHWQRMLAQKSGARTTSAFVHPKKFSGCWRKLISSKPQIRLLFQLLLNGSASCKGSIEDLFQSFPVCVAQ